MIWKVKLAIDFDKAMHEPTLAWCVDLDLDDEWAFHDLMRLIMSGIIPIPYHSVSSKISVTSGMFHHEL